MLKYFSANSTLSYLPILDDFVRQYNTTRHSSIKMTPTDANLKKHEAKVYWNLDGDLPPKQATRYRAGESVRIIKKKGVLEKGIYCKPT